MNDKHAELLDPEAWRPSYTGTRWRKWGDRTLSVFERYGRWIWCIGTASGASHYSKVRYRSEADAKAGLAAEICD